jgi:hypothetical protein
MTQNRSLRAGYQGTHVREPGGWGRVIGAETHASMGCSLGLFIHDTRAHANGKQGEKMGEIDMDQTLDIQTR